MISAKQMAMAALIVVSSFHASTAEAQADWDPLPGLSKLVAWFSQLNEQMDKVIAKEERAQLLRAVDRLRQDLYVLEGNAQVLRDSVPDRLPSIDEREYLSRQAGELLRTVERLSSSVRAVGAELRLNNSTEVEQALTWGLRTRAIVLTDFEHALERSKDGSGTSTRCGRISTLAFRQ